ncbi:MAG: queuosine precursor transporter [Holophagaceae bacterium]
MNLNIEKQPFDTNRFKHLNTLIHVYVVILMVSNLVGQKITNFGSFYFMGHTFDIQFSGAQLLFPITYIFGDIFTEVYGYGASRRAIWIAFFASALMAVMCAFMVWLPFDPAWKNQLAFEAVLGQVPRMVIFSLIAFWAGEFVNSYVLAKMKIMTRGQMLWTRTIGSTIAGQLVDSLIINFGFHAGQLPVGIIINLVVSGYFAKVIYETLMTPITYATVSYLKKTEEVDVYDHETDFNPFPVGQKNGRS